MGADNHRDRAFQYGDGLFTTLAVQNKKPQLWPLHKARLLDDSQRLALPIDLDPLEREIQLQARSINNGVIKIHLSAGVGGRGYQRPAEPKPVITLSTHPIPSYYRQWQDVGIDVDFSPVKLGHQPLLAGIKHLNRLEQVLIKQRLVKDDAIVCDMNDNLIEASASNLFWYAQGAWHTPAITHCGVKGVFRTFVFKVLALLEQPVLESSYPKQQLLTAENVFLCNSLMHIVPVKRLFHEDGVCEFSIDRVTQLQYEVATRLLNDNESLL